MFQSSKSSPFVPFRLPPWAQVLLGLALVSLVYFAGRSSSFVSAWDEQDSNFYEAAMESLRIYRISPSAPTAIIFWEKGCEDCLENLKALQTAPGNLRIYGIHLTPDAASKLDIRRAWVENAPRRAVMLMDQSDILQTSFRVKYIPETFMVLPKQKKIYSFYGNLEDVRKKMGELVASE